MGREYNLHIQAMECMLLRLRLLFTQGQWVLHMALPISMLRTQVSSLSSRCAQAKHQAIFATLWSVKEVNET